MAQNDSIFGDVIYSYTRAQAIEDGVLVEMSGDFAVMAQQAGFRWPLAMTAAAFARYVDLTDAAKAAGNDQKGRWWDICITLRLAIKSAANSPSCLIFEFNCVVDKPTAELCKLKAVVGPDDDGEPCFTIMLPEED